MIARTPDHCQPIYEMAILACLMVFFCLALPTPSQAKDWQLYENKLYGTKVDVPASFKLISDPQKTVGDNKATLFKSPDGTGEIRIFRELEFGQASFSAYLSDRIKSYKDKGGTNFKTQSKDNAGLISGILNDNIIYLYSVAPFCPGTLFVHNIEFRLPNKQNKVWFPYVNQAMKTLKGHCMMN